MIQKRPKQKNLRIVKIIMRVFLVVLFTIDFVACSTQVPEQESVPAETVIVEVVVAVPVIQPAETIIVTEISEIVVVPGDYDFLLEQVRMYEDNEAEAQARYYETLERYPVASEVWLYLKAALGMTNEAAAGVIGNMMNECGGNTLNLQYNVWSKNKTHYGLCQWAKAYHPSISGAGLEAQLEYLGETIEYIFDTYGYLYKKGFCYEDYRTLSSVDEAADAFRVVYERPSAATAATRRYNARLAYCNFVY